MKSATVLIGEPTKEYKDSVGALILADKQAKADVARKKKEQEALRTKLFEEKKRKAEEARKMKEVARKKKEGKDDEEEEEAKVEKMEVEPPAAEEPPVELTEEEKKLWFRKMDLSDLAMASSFANFSMPTKEDGFDSITYAWASEAGTATFLKDWVLQKKLTSRVEDIKPGDGFKEAWAQWQKTEKEWRKKQTEWKDPAKKKALIAAKEEEAKRKAEEEGGEPKELPVIDSEEIEVDDVEDICDLGNGEPLFANFAYEDWSLLSTRYELHLLLHSFKKDLDDSDRPSFSPDHLAFYYSRYFKKDFNLKYFSCEQFSDLAELINDTVTDGEPNNFIKVVMAEGTKLEQFVRLTEEHRRERQRRIDAGDESAKLNFTRPAPVPKAGQAPIAGRGAAGAAPPAAAGVKRPYGAAAPGSYGGAAKQPRIGGYGGGAAYGAGSPYGGSYGRR